MSLSLWAGTTICLVMQVMVIGMVSDRNTHMSSDFDVNLKLLNFSFSKKICSAFINFVNSFNCSISVEYKDQMVKYASLMITHVFHALTFAGFQGRCLNTMPLG